MNKLRALTVCLLILLLSACAENDTLEMQLDDLLSDVHSFEKDGKKSAEQLAKLEQEENELFAKTTALTQEELEAVEENVSILQEKLRKREELLRQEKEALQEARSYLPKLEELLQLADQGEKKAIADLRDSLEKRYETHEELMTQYKDLLEAQSKLYELLADPTVRGSELQKQLRTVNALNEAAQQTTEAFNFSTSEVNHQKERTFRSLVENE